MPTLTTEQIRSAKSVDLLNLFGRDVELTPISAAEYAGPCPFCGGEDRFHAQPGAGRWFCRQCTGDPSVSGWMDAIDYLRRRDNLGFREAVVQLTQGYALATAPVPKPHLRSAGRRQRWRTSAWQSLAWSEVCAAQSALAAAEGEAAPAYLYARALSPPTWQAWGLGLARPWHPLRRKRLPAILLPWWKHGRLCAVQYRFFAPDLGRRERYSQRPGGERFLFGLQLLQQHRTLFLVEGELNALSLWQVVAEAADVLSWGPQGNLLRPQVLSLCSRLLGHYQRLLVWADELEVAERGLAAMLDAGLCPQKAATIHAPCGLDANDLLKRGELRCFIDQFAGKSPSLPCLPHRQATTVL